MKNKLALFGGQPIRKTLFPDQNTMGGEEKYAVERVMSKGRLSGYRANNGKCFYGGDEIKTLETEWNSYFKCSAIPCNSATSALFVACCAIELKPEDEVIVTPYSMTCSATIPLWFRAKPVFADVEPDFFCIDPIDVEKKITKKTKAIISVDLFGQPCDYDTLKEIIGIAEQKYKHKIYLITDTAQAPGAMYNEKFTGTIGDIGIFSFNFGKHMTCGEGGMISTDDQYLLHICRLIINHAESVINDISNTESYSFLSRKVKSMIGLNLRMTELQAAIATEQLKKLKTNIAQRRKNVEALKLLLGLDIPPIQLAKTRTKSTHVYYTCPFKWDTKITELHRDIFLKAVRAELTPRKGRDQEGIQISGGYIKPIYLMPVFQTNGSYQKLHLPVVERLWKNELFLTLYHAPNSTQEDMMSLLDAFLKVWYYKDDLIKWSKNKNYESWRR